MKTHPKILELKKLFKSYGIEVKSTYNNTISIHLITYSYNSSDNYLTIWNFDRTSPIALFKNNLKTIQIYFESISKIETKLKHYGILPVQTFSITQKRIQSSIDKVAQSQLQNSHKNNTRLLGSKFPNVGIY